MNESQAAAHEDVQCPICGSLTERRNVEEVTGTLENLRAENKALREARSAALMVTTTKTLEYVSGQKISS